jgi:hypothetical protein
MDPITAFSLTVGVLQVVDVSCKALSKCQELYKDGSLAEHRSTKEITQHLGKHCRNHDLGLTYMMRLTERRS